MSKVDTQHADYSKYLPKWQRCRDASDGQDAVHAAGTKYLPKLKDQTDDDYAAYKTRAGFYNATWRTMAGLLGMMFRKSPQTDLPAQVEQYAADIDMAGTTLETFARKVALEVLKIGRVGIMVDHPRTEGATPISVAAANDQGLRPLITSYRAEAITNWRYVRIRNRWVLGMVTLKECAKVQDGEFAEKDVDQYRVLDLDEAGLYRVRLFQKDEKDKREWLLVDEFWPLMNSKPLDFIPFAILGTDGVDSTLDEPPLIDLIDTNLSHYRTNADYEHGCHFTGLPTLFLSGFGPDEKGEMPTFYIGSQAAIVSSHPDADGKFIEFTGQGLGSLKENLDRKEQQMAVLGARMLFAEKRQVEAAETAAIHRSGENSVLSALASGISEGLEWALGVFAQWAGVSGAQVVYQLNRDYNPAMLDAQQLTALLRLVQAGEMSSQELYTLLQRGDIVDSEQDFETHQEQIAQQGPSRPDMGMVA